VAGYLVHHQSYLFDGVRADYYRNDPYVWFAPCLWSFCHPNQRPRIERGMTVLWLSKADGTYVCDLVFVVGEILPFHAALGRYSHEDAGLVKWHFERGRRRHREVERPDAKTYVADMARSYIPHPAVPIEAAVDEIRERELPNPRPLAVASSKPSTPLRIDAIDGLERIVRARAAQRLTGSLGPGGWSPGQEDELPPRRRPAHWP
jgi:hypothetical protein